MSPTSALFAVGVRQSEEVNMSAITSHDISFPVASHTAMGYLTAPAQAGGPAVLVLHAWWGLNAVFKGVCDRLAEDGFIALAPDLYAGEVATTIEEAERLQQAMDGD